MYDKEKLREVNERENKGVRDIIDTEESVNGVFELDGQFSNGYHVYIPYGISVDLQDALGTSIQSLEQRAHDVQESIDRLKTNEDMAAATLAYSLELVKKEFEVQVKVLRAFAEVHQSI